MNAGAIDLLANTILVIHLLFVLGVGLPVPLIIAGGLRRWRWVRSFKWRLLHVCMIGFVVWESLIGMMCPLTVWENKLRLLSGRESYGDSFMAAWLHRILFWNASPQFFTVLYCSFGALVAFLWWWARPVRAQP